MVSSGNFVKLDTWEIGSEAIFRPQIPYALQLFTLIVATCLVLITDCA